MAHTNTCPEPELLSMYGLGMLEQREHDRVEQHISACWKCRAEIASVADTLGTLALTVPIETPDPALKTRVFKAVDQVQRSPAQSPRRFRLPLWSLGLAVAALIMAIGLSTYREVPSAHYRAIQQAVTNAKRQGANVVALEGTKDAPKARGEMYVVRGGTGDRRVVIAVEGLAQPPGDGVYCLWLIKDGRRSVGGWVTVDQNGKGGLVFDTNESFDTVGVTLEPDPDYDSGSGGQIRPRGPKVLGIPQI